MAVFMVERRLTPMFACLLDYIADAAKVLRLTDPLLPQETRTFWIRDAVTSNWLYNSNLCSNFPIG